MARSMASSGIGSLVLKSLPNHRPSGSSCMAEGGVEIIEDMA
jgi:hypothetical protein